MGRSAGGLLVLALAGLAVGALSEPDIETCASLLLELASSPACLAAEDVGTCDAGCTQLAQSIPEDCGSSAVEDRLHAHGDGLAFLQTLVKLCSWNQSFATALTTGASIHISMGKPHAPRSRADPQTYKCLSQFQRLLYRDACFTKDDSNCAASSDCTESVAALPEDCVTDAFYERFSSTTMPLSYFGLMVQCQWGADTVPALYSVFSRAQGADGSVSMDLGGFSDDKGQEPAVADEVTAQCLAKFRQVAGSKECVAALATGEDCAACDAQGDDIPEECMAEATLDKVMAQDPVPIKQIARIGAKCKWGEKAGKVGKEAGDTSVPSGTAAGSSATKEAAPADAGQTPQHTPPTAQKCREALGRLVDSPECGAALSSGACTACTATAAGVPGTCASDAVFDQLSAQDPATLIKLSELVRACGADGTGLFHASAPLLSTRVKPATGTRVGAAGVDAASTSGAPPSPTHHAPRIIGTVLFVAAAGAAVWVGVVKYRQQAPKNTYRELALQVV